MAWIIVNKEDENLLWSSTDGWTSENYDTFSNEEMENTDLPMLGEWERVSWVKWEN